VHSVTRNEPTRIERGGALGRVPRSSVSEADSRHDGGENGTPRVLESGGNAWVPSPSPSEPPVGAVLRCSVLGAASRPSGASRRAAFTRCRGSSKVPGGRAGSMGEGNPSLLVSQEEKKRSAMGRTPRTEAVKVRLTKQDYATLREYAGLEESTPGGLASLLVGQWCFERRTEPHAVRTS